MGTVNLDGESDHSGITLGIYEIVTLDTTITRINNQYPHIGIKISQHTEFDHRFGTLIKTGETDASGYFQITDIPTGVYNVVAIKDGFGFRYVYEISISDGDNSLSDVMKQSPFNHYIVDDERNFVSEKRNGKREKFFSPLPSPISQGEKTPKTYGSADITLFPATHITSDITSPTTFLSHHHYIIEQDIIVDDELTIQPGAVVRLNQGKEITSYGTFNAVGEYENFIWFTKNDGFSENLSSTEPDSNYIWDIVTLEPYSQAQVQWCKFDWANVGLHNYINGFEIFDCIFRESQCGFKAESVDSTFCSNLLCGEIYNAEQAGIYFLTIANGLIERNIVNDCENGIKIKNNSNSGISNNYIGNCYIGINISYYCESQIFQNNIESCSECLKIIGQSYSEITKNFFSGNICIGFNTQIYSQYNNLKSEIFQFYTYYGEGKSNSCQNNYYYTTDSSEIEESIFDKNDVEPNQQPFYGIVDYKPFLKEEYQYCGIQQE